MVSNPPVIDETENITADDLRKPQKNIFQSDLNIQSILEPSLNFINFDDIIFNNVNSIIISRNRYAGVSFYSPYSNYNTYLTWYYRYSNPNSLVVGYEIYNPQTGGYDVHSNDRTVIDFAQPAKDVAFLWGQSNNYYNAGWIDIYTDNYTFVTTVPVSIGNWSGISLNQYSQRIKRLVLRRPSVTNTLFGHIHIDNFQFTPTTTSPPIGTLETVSIQEGAALGWSADPDNQSASNLVHCYINGQFAGAVNANLPGGGAPYAGNHRFSFPIPIQYRDGIQHYINCYGLDVTGGDSPTLLAGSPKTFRFNAPIGTFESVNSDGIAIGWSLDPDVPTQSNVAHFYINGPAGGGGTYIGQAFANIPHYVAGYPGNHGFRYSIPAQYRDGQPHTLYAYGLDLTGDNSKPLSGNPKTFNLTPVVQSTVLIALPESPLSDNNNAGGGKRIFYDKLTPTDTVDRSIVKVKVTLSAPTQGITVYVKKYDIDEPATDTLPLDTNGNSNGGDNRGYASSSLFCSIDPLNVCPLSSNAVQYTTTDNNGEAIFYLTVKEANSGDNFAVATSTKEIDIRQSAVFGLDIKDYITDRIFQIGTDRTEMLTAWRKLHIEIDSMGIVQNNYSGTSVTDEYVVGASQVTIPLRNTIDSRRFQNGRMLITNNNLLFIDYNNSRSVTVHNTNGTATVLPYYLYTLYDDDDFNNDNLINGFDADNGEDVITLPDSFNLLQENDDTNCSDGYCNVFAAAYIQPEYVWANPYNTSNIPFVQNLSFDFNTITNQIAQGRNSNSDEDDDFWIVYMQVVYQSGLDDDCDPNEETATGGVTPSMLGDTLDDATNIESVPKGSQGSLVYIETMQDFDRALGNVRLRTKSIPHEIGHQFGIRGDDPDPNNPPDFGLMDPFDGRNFVDRHLNVIRWRRKSPGVPVN